MTRIILPMIGVLLALLSNVDAKSKKSRIQLYRFQNDACLYNPILGNVDLEHDKCVDLGTLPSVVSVKPMFDPTRGMWLDDINTGKQECFLSIFQEQDCSGRPVQYNLPDQMQACARQRDPTQRVAAAKFWCQDKTEPSTVLTITSTSAGITWSAGIDNLVSSHPVTQTLTITTTSALTPSAARHIENRTVWSNGTYVWMKHPWSDGFICYRCSQKAAPDADRMKCWSDYKAECGPEPPHDDLGVPSTSTVSFGTTATSSTVVDDTLIQTTTMTSVTTTTPIISTTVITTVFTSSSTITPSTTSSTVGNLERGSWHKRVAFANPWTKKRMCGDAEWEKRGQAKGEIRIQDVKRDITLHGCKGALELDPPSPVTTTSHITSTATGFDHFTTVTETTTVSVGTDTGPTTTVWPSVMPRQVVDDNVPHHDL